MKGGGVRLNRSGQTRRQGRWPCSFQAELASCCAQGGGRRGGASRWDFRGSLGWAGYFGGREESGVAGRWLLGSGGDILPG